jgi:hypothetical protein
MDYFLWLQAADIYLEKNRPRATRARVTNIEIVVMQKLADFGKRKRQSQDRRQDRTAWPV